MTKKKQNSLDLRLIKVLAHPLRHRLLQALNHEVASPSDLARELNEPLTTVAYHVKVLLENGAIEEVRTAPVRGTVEHFYRATMRPWFDDEMWARLPAPARRTIFGEILRDSWADVVAASEEGGLDDPTTHISRALLDLDDEAYEELTELLTSVLERALELHAESAARLAQLPEQEREEHRTALMLMHFHRATKGGSDALPQRQGKKHRRAKAKARS
jgi:DNA-binding transcriptional ArsR family regulator